MLCQSNEKTGAFHNHRKEKPMHPKEKMNEDLKVAMKSGDNKKKDALRFILAAIKQKEIDTRTTLTEEQTHDLLQTEAKKRRDSIAEAQKLGRHEMEAQEQMEL